MLRCELGRGKSRMGWKCTMRWQAEVGDLLYLTRSDNCAIVIQSVSYAWEDEAYCEMPYLAAGVAFCVWEDAGQT